MKLFINKFLFPIFVVVLSISLVKSQSTRAKVVKGNVFDAQYNLPVDAHVTYILLPSEDIFGSFHNSEKHGNYNAYLPENGTYKIIIKAKGYEELVDTLVIESDTTIELNLLLNPKGVGQILHTKNLVFERDSHKILEESYPELDRIVKLLKEHPEKVIRLEGHTDYGSHEEDNLELSAGRIESVKKYLVSKGIDAKRIKLQAYGSSRPIVISPDPQKRAANRRVDIVILKR